MDPTRTTGRLGAEAGVFSGRHDRRKVTDWVYEELREAIIGLRLQPGEPLREAAIADQLGVSKTPVREALSRLEQEGLVETASFKGAVVSGYSQEDLREIYQLRELLEGAAARFAAESMHSATLHALESLVSEGRRLRDAGDTAELADLLGEFDRVVFDQVENRRIRGLIENLQAHLTRVGRLTEEIPGRVDASVDEHERIVAAIRARDADGAERAMREHIRSVLGDQLDAMPGGGSAP
jgi:GntR family transcriptional regulator, rspAB operon transcriptional repressor